MGTTRGSRSSCRGLYSSSRCVECLVLQGLVSFCCVASFPIAVASLQCNDLFRASFWSPTQARALPAQQLHPSNTAVLQAHRVISPARACLQTRPPLEDTPHPPAARGAAATRPCRLRVCGWATRLMRDLHYLGHSWQHGLAGVMRRCWCPRLRHAERPLPSHSPGSAAPPMGPPPGRPAAAAAAAICECARICDAAADCAPAISSLCCRRACAQAGQHGLMLRAA